MIALCRFMLNLRGVYITNDTWSPSQLELTTTVRNSDMRLVSQVVGNFGAPLEVQAEGSDSDVDVDMQPLQDFDEDSSSRLHKADVTVHVVQNDPLSAGLFRERRTMDNIEMDSRQDV